MCDMCSYFFACLCSAQTTSPSGGKTSTRRLKGVSLISSSLFKIFYLLYIINTIIYKLANNQVLVLKTF